MAFIGMQILMWVVQVPNLGIYWSSNPFLGNTGFQRVMSRNRFQDLPRYFHLSDNSTQPPCCDPNDDRLNKVRPVIDMDRANFRERYQPGQHQSIDEGMVKYNGQYFAKQYMPAKPVKRGFKIWMRCESSGYCGNFRPYLGKHDQFRGRDLGERVVLHLCRPLKWKGHHVFLTGSLPVSTWSRGNLPMGYLPVVPSRQHQQGFQPVWLPLQASTEGTQYNVSMTTLY